MKEPSIGTKEHYSFVENMTNNRYKIPSYRCESEEVLVRDFLIAILSGEIKPEDICNVNKSLQIKRFTKR